MKISFLGQGLSNSKASLGALLIEALSNKKFNTFICFVAFASSSGINGLSKYIKKAKKHMKVLRIFVGIDQKGTSKEALEALLKLKIDTRIYYTTSHIIFHPKIYLFAGDKDCCIILGSSNLTQPGLFQNIEASLLVEFDKSDVNGVSLLNQVYVYFDSFLKGKDRNIQILNKELIKRLYKYKIIPNEKERKKIQEKIKLSEKETKESVLADIQKLFPSIKIQKPPKGFRKRKKAKRMLGTTIMPGVIGNKGMLLWRKTKLPPSDVQYAKSGTNPTGGIRLTQADWVVNKKKIDWTKYFRNGLFGNFKWRVASISPKVEITKVSFNVEILGINKGKHKLEIRHKPSGEAGQGNYTTSLSWGKLSNIIQKQGLKGKTLFLYGPQQGKKEPFYIEIK